LDSFEHLADAVSEVGASREQAEDLAVILGHLGEWRVPLLTPEDTRQLVARLRPYVPLPSPVRQALRARRRGLWNDLRSIVALVRSQVSILQPAFWLVSALVVLLGGLLLFSVTGLNQAVILYVVGPMLSYLGTVSAFRGSRLHVLEFELACPPSPRQLTLARLTIILSYDVALGILMTLLFWAWSGVGFAVLTMHWLAPLLLGVGVTLLLSLRLPVNHAAALTYVGWLIALVLTIVGQSGALESTSLFSGATELAVSLVGLVCIGGVVLYLPRATPGLLPRH
jgi:hypothetical protein